MRKPGTRERRNDQPVHDAGPEFAVPDTEIRGAAAIRPRLGAGHVTQTRPRGVQLRRFGAVAGPEGGHHRAGSGIGRAGANAFAREGADVVLSYLPAEQPDADEVVALIDEAGRKAVAAPGDLTDPAYCRDLIATAVQQLGGVEILGNVAGKTQNV